MTTTNDPTRTFQTVKAYAAEWGVRPETVRRWIREGHLEAVRMGPLGRLRVRRWPTRRTRKSRGGAHALSTARDTV